MNEPQALTPTLTLELVPSETETRDWVSTRRRVAAVPVAVPVQSPRYGSTEDPSHLQVDSFGKVVVLAASYYDQKEIPSELARSIDSLELGEVVFEDIPQAKNKDKEEPRRVVVRLESSVRPVGKLSVGPLTTPFKSWQEPVWLVTAALLTIASGLMLWGVRADKEAIVAWGVLLIGICMAGWGLGIVAYVLLVLKDIKQIVCRSFWGSKHLHEDKDIN